MADERLPPATEPPPTPPLPDGTEPWTDDQAVPTPADCDEYLTRPCLCGPACCPHCPHVAAIAGMLASRYSGQPTQRDLDVANVAAATERERIRQLGFETEGNDGKYLLIRADLLDGGTDALA